VTAHVLRGLDAVGDLDELARGGVGIGERRSAANFMQQCAFNVAIWWWLIA
jgi:hypothetical protein